MTGGGGNDTIDGGVGTDTAIYSGLASNFQWVENPDGSWTVTDLRSGNPNGVDTLWNVESLQFGDSLVMIDSDTPPPAGNTAPTMTSAAPAVSLTEWADRSASEAANAPHTASGALTYADPDLGQVHGATFKAQGANYVGTFSLNSSNIDTGQSVGWSFTVSDSAINNLKAGQTLVQKYDVAINDGNGGSTTQTVTVTLVGANDSIFSWGAGSFGGNGNDLDPGSKAADVLSLLGMQQDQMPAPYGSLQTYGGVDPTETAPERRCASL